jgi:hypothetical protein
MFQIWVFVFCPKGSTESVVWEDTKSACPAKYLDFLDECAAVNVPKFEDRILG